MRFQHLGQLASSTALTVAQLLKQPPNVGMKVCVREMESDREKHLCVSVNTSVQLSLLKWEMINVTKCLCRRWKPYPPLAQLHKESIWKSVSGWGKATL